MLPQEVNAEERTQSFSDQRHAALLKDYEKLKMQHKQLKDEIDQYCLLIVEMQSSLDMAKENESGYLNREAHLWAEIDNNKKKLALCKDKEQKAEHERLKWNAKQKDYLEREKQFKNEIASLKDDMEKKLLSINKLENQLDSVLEQFESALSEKKECELRAEQMEKENNELRKMMSELSAEITELDEWTKKKEERGERAWELEHSEKQKFRNETFGAESNRLIEDLHVSIAHLEKEKKELLTKLQRLNKESIEKEAE
ncbi:uncharacterized protein MONOS_17004 [Monocercomonoides exilis]|nr:hypothetical protein MONOS_17004 [Monocercomonoides exilis]